jgi:hypothetical protein
VRELLGARERFRGLADEALASARSKVEDLQRKRSRVLSNSLELDLSSEEGDVVREKLARLRQQITAAEAEVREIEEQTRSHAMAWGHLTDILSETRNLADAWDSVELAERKILLDMWVLDVVVVVEPISGRKKANRKTAYVTLRSAPDLPRELDLSLKQARASSSSSRTRESSSTDSRSASAAEAEGDGISPSAQAACPRTNGSESGSASSNGGTASAAPQLPSATATLRLKPAYLDRRIADPRVHSSHSSYVMRMSEISDGTDVPGKASRC